MTKRYVEDGVVYIVDPDNKQVQEAAAILDKYAEFVSHCLKELAGCDVKTQEGRDDAVTCLGAAAYSSAQLAEHLTSMYTKNLDQLPEDVRDRFDCEIAKGVARGLRLVTGAADEPENDVESSTQALPDRKANLH